MKNLYFVRYCEPASYHPNGFLLRSKMFSSDKAAVSFAKRTFERTGFQCVVEVIHYSPHIGVGCCSQFYSTILDSKLKGE